MNPRTTNSKLWVQLSVIPIVVLIYLFCFHHLDWLSIQFWDEGLFALRAVYLAKTGEVLKKFSSFPLMNPHGNTKPPLVTFLQAMLLRNMDNYLLALRLPSAIAQAVLALFILYVTKLNFKNYWIGFLALLIFLCSIGLYVGHIARFGDQDMPFALFLFMSLYFLFAYINNAKTSSILLAIFFFFCSYYVKSVLAYVIFPGVLVYILFDKHFSLFKKPINYIYAASFLVPIVISILSEDTHHKNATRFVSAVEYDHSWNYYLDLFINEYYLMPWIFFFFISAIVSYFSKNLFLRYIIIQTVIILAILSYAKMMLPHYVVVIYPLVAVGASYSLFLIAQGFYKQLPIKNDNIKKIVLGLAIALIFIMPIKNILHYTYTPDETREENYLGMMLDKHKKENLPYKQFTIVTTNLPLAISFYKYLFEWKYGYAIQVDPNLNKSFANNTFVMFNKSEVPDLINCYELQIVRENGKTIFAKILKEK